MCNRIRILSPVYTVVAKWQTMTSLPCCYCRALQRTGTQVHCKILTVIPQLQRFSIIDHAMVVANALSLSQTMMTMVHCGVAMETLRAGTFATGMTTAGLKSIFRVYSPTVICQN